MNIFEKSKIKSSGYFWIEQRSTWLSFKTRYLVMDMIPLGISHNRIGSQTHKITN